MAVSWHFGMKFRSVANQLACSILAQIFWHDFCTLSVMTNIRNINRRCLIAGLTGLTAIAATSTASAGNHLFSNVGLRGGFDADLSGLLPDVADDQSARLQQAIDAAAARGRILRLPAGHFYFSNLTLPDGARLAGIPGATVLAYTGQGHGLLAEGAQHIGLEGIRVDGANQRLGEHVRGIVHLRGVTHVSLNQVTITGSSRYGLMLEACGGEIRSCDISGAAEAGLFAIESKDLSIRDNYVHDCGNGGILIHRWSKGEDATVVIGNRVARISARSGGTGQYGNGINVFRAGNVMVANNHVSDCAFSAIRANSADNVQIVANQAIRSGETAVYAEFSFQGAVIANNLVDGGTMGISVANFDVGGRLSVISGNIIRNMSDQGPYKAENSGFGIGIAVEADASVSGNTIEGAPKWGIMAGWGPFLRDVAITGNIIRKAGVGVAVSVVEGTGQTIITDNIFSDTPGGAVAGHRWNEKVTKDLGLVGARRFPNLTVERNAVS